MPQKITIEFILEKIPKEISEDKIFLHLLNLQDPAKTTNNKTIDRFASPGFLLEVLTGWAYAKTMNFNNAKALSRGPGEIDFMYKENKVDFYFDPFLPPLDIHNTKNLYEWSKGAFMRHTIGKGSEKSCVGVLDISYMSDKDKIYFMTDILPSFMEQGNINAGKQNDQIKLMKNKNPAKADSYEDVFSGIDMPSEHKESQFLLKIINNTCFKNIINTIYPNNKIINL